MTRLRGWFRSVGSDAGILTCWPDDSSWDTHLSMNDFGGQRLVSPPRSRFFTGWRGGSDAREGADKI